MRTGFLLVCAALVVTPGLSAQQTSTPPGSPDAQAVALLRRFSQHSSRLGPLLEQVQARDWVAKGASETYAVQLTSAQRQIEGIGNEMEALTQHPERMQECMQALFRVQTFHRTLDSLIGGLRRYQNPALADLIQAVALEDNEDLAKMQDYILDLANQRDQDYLVVEHEAQRCRATLTREPSLRPKGK